LSNLCVDVLYVLAGAASEEGVEEEIEATGKEATEPLLARLLDVFGTDDVVFEVLTREDKEGSLSLSGDANS
jgi:hypothetical protein